MVETSSKAPKSTKEDSCDEGSTDEEMALVVLRNFKKFMKRKFHKKDGYDKKKPNHRRCYECKELDH